MGVAIENHSDLLRTTLPDLPRGKNMPLTKKGCKILAAMKKQYGKVRGKEVFYKSQNKGIVKGTHR